MKTTLLQSDDVESLFNKYSEWLKDNQDNQVVTTCMFQRFYGSAGSAYPTIFLLVTWNDNKK